jgi:hypothetical protein
VGVYTLDRHIIWCAVLSDIVISTVEGYNGCIFAYGQTSSGKIPNPKP